MHGIKKLLDLSNRPLSKSSWAALSSLSFAVLRGGWFNKTVVTIREALGWKTRAVWSVEYKVICSSWVFEDRGCTHSSWIDFYLVSLLGSTQVRTHQFQHVHPYYPSRSKQKEIEFTFVAGNKLLWPGHEEEEWLQCCQSNQGPLELSTKPLRRLRERTIISFAMIRQKKGMVQQQTKWEPKLNPRRRFHKKQTP